MGLYLDAADNAAWIKEFGTKVDSDQGIEDDELNIVVVDNIAFKAYLVTYSVEEYNFVKTNFDDRPKQWYVAKKEDIKKICPEWNKYVQ